MWHAASWALQREPGLLVTGPKDQLLRDAITEYPRLDSLSSSCSPLALKARNSVCSTGRFQRAHLLTVPKDEKHGEAEVGESSDGHLCHHWSSC